MSALWKGASPRARAGTAMIAAGLLMILWGVFHVLGAVEPPRSRDFAHRQTYVQVKQAVHGSLFGGLARALPGLALMMLGSRWRTKVAQSASTPPGPTDPQPPA